MSNIPDDILQQTNQLFIGIRARLNKLRALGQTVDLTVQRTGSAARTFENSADITFTMTKR